MWNLTAQALRKTFSFSRVHNLSDSRDLLHVQKLTEPSTDTVNLPVNNSDDVETEMAEEATETVRGTTGTHMGESEVGHAMDDSTDSKSLEYQEVQPWGVISLESEVEERFNNYTEDDSVALAENSEVHTRKGERMPCVRNGTRRAKIGLADCLEVDREVPSLPIGAPKRASEHELLSRRERSLSEALPGLGAVSASVEETLMPMPKTFPRSAAFSAFTAKTSPPLLSVLNMGGNRDKFDVTWPPDTTDAEYLSRLEVPVMHSVLIMAIIVVAALLLAMRRDGRGARFAKWLFLLGSTVHIQNQRNLRDFFRSCQPSLLLRNLISPISRIRAILRNRRQNCFSIASGRRRSYTIQYCPLKWVESSEGDNSSDVDESTNLRCSNSACEMMSNRKSTRAVLDAAETSESKKRWKQAWDIAPCPSNELLQQHFLNHNSDSTAGEDGSGSVEQNDSRDFSAAVDIQGDVVDSRGTKQQGEEDLMNYFIKGSWNTKRIPIRTEYRREKDNHQRRINNSEQESSGGFSFGSHDNIDDVEQGRSSKQIDVSVDTVSRYADCLFPGNHKLHFQAILTSAKDVQWVISLTPLARYNESWTLLYSTARDGVSLNTLFRANETVGGTGPALMLIRDDGDAVFGAYTSDRWHREKIGRCYGTGEAFVFTVSPERARYSWTQANYLFQSGSSSSLSLGGGSHFALWLDGELQNGTSGTCETFGSPCLSSKPDFRIKQLEVWGFAALNRV